MPNENMDAIALLKADHREVEALFEKFEKTRGAQKQAQIVQTICNELTIHATIEEEIFYPAIRNYVEDDGLDEAYVEHDCAKVLITDLRNADPDEEYYKAKVTVLKELIEHHVKEEERSRDSLFAQAKTKEVDLVALGQQLGMRKEELMAQVKNGAPPAPVMATLELISV
jgi:Hemerythrin HHE cation binding domain